MATEQANTYEAIMQAVAEAVRTAIQTMAMAGEERTQNVGPILGRPFMKELTFDWSSTDKYAELRNFKWR